MRTAAEIAVLAAGAAKIAGIPYGTPYGTSEGTPGIPYVPSQDNNNSNNSKTSGAAGKAGTPGAGKQYYYPDTFVGREIEPTVKKPTVDQQLILTVKKITDKPPQSRRVTPVQITVPPGENPKMDATPNEWGGYKTEQRPATSMEDLKQVRWNSASYHQLTPDEKKFVEYNDRAQGFDRMTGGQNDPFAAPRPIEIRRESYNPEKQQIVEYYQQVLAQKLMEQEHWGMDKVKDAIKRQVINPESYESDENGKPTRKGMGHIHSALEGGTISVPPTGGIGYKKEVTNYTRPMDRVFIGQKIFPDNRSAQASLHWIMRSMANIHSSHPDGADPTLEGTVPHDPATHAALNQLDPSTVAHTLNLRKAWKQQYP